MQKPDEMESVQLLRYQPGEFPIAIARIARSLSQPREKLIERYRDQKDLLAGLDVGLMAILLQVRAEPEPILDDETLDLAEICSARLRNLVFANDNWFASAEWDSVSNDFSRLRERLTEYLEQ